MKKTLLFAHLVCTAFGPMVAQEIATPVDHTLFLVKDHVAQATIVVEPPNSAKGIKAAKAIQDTVKQSTGAIIQIQDAPTPGNATIIIRSETDSSLLSDAPTDKLVKNDRQWWRVKREGLTVLVAGNDEGLRTGTFSAAALFLRETLGVNYFHFGPDGLVIPSSADLVVKDLDKTVIPAFGYRALYPYHCSPTANLAADSDYMKWVMWTSQPGVPTQHQHIFENIFPPEHYFKAHPEYYSELRGVRTVSDPAGWQPCTSNPEVIRLTVEHVRRWLDAHPDQISASVSMNDSSTFCECAECKKLDGPEPEVGPAHRAVLFANAVASEIAKSHPGRKVGFYAYHHLVNPPHGVQCLDNVAVIFADSFACAVHKLGDPQCGLALDSLARLKKWCAIAKNVVFYDYLGPSGEFLGTPYVNLQRLTDNAKTLQQIGVNGITYDAHFAPGPMGLQYWAAVQLAVDPSLTASGILDTFCSGLYGPASEEMKLYYTTIEKAYASSGFHANWVTWAFPGTLHVWKAPLFQQLSSILDRAAKLVAPDSLSGKNVQQQKLILDYTQKYCDLKVAQRAYWKAPSDSALDSYRTLRYQYLKAIKVVEEKQIMSFSPTMLGYDCPETLEPLAPKKTILIDNSLPENGNLTGFVNRRPPVEAEIPWLFDELNYWSYPITGVQMFADKERLVFKIKCHAPFWAEDPAAPSDEKKLDVIRLNFYPQKKDQKKFDISVSANGQMEINGVLSTNPNKGIQSEIVRENKVGFRFWTVLLSIPINQLPSVNNTFRLNISRQCAASIVQPLQSWVPTFGEGENQKFSGTIEIVTADEKK